jgi:hypothetical protein
VEESFKGILDVRQVIQRLQVIRRQRETNKEPREQKDRSERHWSQEDDDFETVRKHCGDQESNGLRDERD